MKNLITSALLGLVLVAGTASAEKVKFCLLYTSPSPRDS